MKHPYTTRQRLSTAGAVATLSVLLAAGTAHAHVSVDPEEAPQGDYGTVAFKVPNERDNASTVKLEVHFPEDQPLASVMPEPVPGWDIEVTKRTLDKPLKAHGQQLSKAVRKITWTGGEIKPGQFQQFPVSMGELPKDSEQMVFKTLQTYDNDEVVRWIEAPQKNGPEPEHPAPVLQLAADDAPSGDRSGQDVNSATTDESAEQSGADYTARVLGVIGIVIGVGGIAYGALAGRRRAS